MKAALVLKRSVLSVSLVLIVGLFFGMVATARSQSGAFDPQSLVGQWSGQWTATAGIETGGKYYLTIEKVEGNKVFGKGQIVGRQATDFTVQGTLDGNRLSWGTVVLTVDGNRMIGRGRNQSSISLTKEK